MDTLERVRSVNSLADPVSTLWNVDSATVFGTLRWAENKPELQLFVEVALTEASSWGEVDHPVLNATKPPIQACVVGHCEGHGTITLEGCARYNVRGTSDHINGKTIYTLYFLPTRIWLGTLPADEKAPITGITLLDTRLGGYFRSPGFKSHYLSPDERADVFERLGTPEQIWCFHQDDGDPIKLGMTGFELKLASTISNSMSHTTGYGVQSVTRLDLKPREGAPREECERVVSQLQDLLTVFSLEPFSFLSITFYSDDSGPLTLAWQLGDWDKSFVPPMAHQILVDFTDQDVFRTACENWFGATETLGLSRWLYCKAIRETNNGMARFISVAQSFEVLGREFASAEKRVSKTERSNALAAIAKALEQVGTGEYFATRIVNLVRSSNATSYPEVLKDMILPVAKILTPDHLEQAKSFCKLVADTRNNLVHMTDDRAELDAAFARVNKLSLKLCYWYALVQAHHLGLPLNRAETFLVNNRTARHGLPNEVLETL